jgi:hypothetical protein
VILKESLTVAVVPPVLVNDHYFNPVSAINQDDHRLGISAFRNRKFFPKAMRNALLYLNLVGILHYLEKNEI